MRQKIVTAILCASIALALMIQFYCTKMDETTEKSGVKSETQSKTDPTAAKSQSAATEENSSGNRGPILPTNTLEKPLTAFTGADKKPTDGTYSILSGSPYNCGSSLSGNYYSSGYYRYPDYTLDLNLGFTINLSVTSYDVPNRFSVYDSSYNLVASTGWMGYANYSGPWGMSLNTQQSQILSFQVSCFRPSTKFYLRVETSTQGYSDSWNASIGCTAPSQSCEDQSYQILISSQCQNYIQKRNDFLDKISFAINKGNALNSVRNACLQAVQYNNYQIVDTMVFNGTLDRQTFLSSFENAKTAFYQAYPFIQQNPSWFTCQSCGTTEVDWTNYFFDNFGTFMQYKLIPPDKTDLSGAGVLTPTCGSWRNQVLLGICVTGAGATTAGLATPLAVWGCWCTFCTKNSWVATKICAN